MEKGRKYKSLASDVIAVATWGFGEWTAYIGAATSYSHDEDVEKVAKNGDKLKKEIAEIIFPELAEQFTFRD